MVRKLNKLSRRELGVKVFPDDSESAATQKIRRIEVSNQKIGEEVLRRIAATLNVSYKELSGEERMSIDNSAYDYAIDEKIDHLIEMLQIAYKTKDYKTMAMLCGRAKEEIQSFIDIESEGED